MHDRPEISVVASALQLGLGFVFLVSALPKLRHPLAFGRNVDAYNVLPPAIVPPFALALVLIETALALAFLTGQFTNFAAPLAVIVITMFLLAVGINLQRGRSVACGCFGDADQRISRRTLVRLLLLMLAVVSLLVLREVAGAGLAIWPSVPADIPRLAYLLHVAAVAGFVIMLSMWLLSLPELLGLARYMRRVHRPSASD